MFNGNIDSQNKEYVSDYPQVFFTDNYVSSYNSQNLQTNYKTNNNNIISNLLNSDIVKQLLPFLLGGKSNYNNENFISIMQNFNPNISKIISSLGLLNNKNKNFKEKDAKTIIDMSDYKEVD